MAGRSHIYADMGRTQPAQGHRLLPPPTVPTCCHNLVAGVGDGSIEFDFDTTRAITSLLYNGVLSKFPDVRIIVNHSGAAVPVLAGRIKDRVPGASSNPDGKFNATEGKTDKIPNSAFYELQKLYECAHAAYPAPGRATAIRFHVAIPVWNRPPDRAHGVDGQPAPQCQAFFRRPHGHGPR